MRSIRERFHLLLLILAIPFVMFFAALYCWASIVVKTIEDLVKTPEENENEAKNENEAAEQQAS